MPSTLGLPLHGCVELTNLNFGGLRSGDACLVVLLFSDPDPDSGDDDDVEEDVDVGVRMPSNTALTSV